MIENSIQQDYMSADDVLNNIHTVKMFLDRTSHSSLMSSSDALIDALNTLNDCRRFLDKKQFSEEELELYYEVDELLNEKLEEYATHEQEKDFYEYN